MAGKLDHVYLGFAANKPMSENKEQYDAGELRAGTAVLMSGSVVFLRPEGRSADDTGTDGGLGQPSDYWYAVVVNGGEIGRFKGDQASPLDFAGICSLNDDGISGINGLVAHGGSCVSLHWHGVPGTCELRLKAGFQQDGVHAEASVLIPKAD